MENIRTKKKSIIIITSAVLLYTLITIFSEESSVITNHHFTYILHKLSVIVASLAIIFFAAKERFLHACTHAVFILTFYYICIGELFYPGYNLAYIQLVLGVPLILKLEIRTSLLYITAAFISYHICFHFGAGSKVSALNYPFYIPDIYFSTTTATALSFFTTLMLRREQKVIEAVRSRLFSFGLRSSILIHDFKKNIEYSEDGNSTQLDETVFNIKKFLSDYTEDPHCHFHTCLEEILKKFKDSDIPIKCNSSSIPSDLVVNIPPLIFESILFNIFVNSFKACFNNKIETEITITRNRSRITISDNGPGFSNELLSNKLTDPKLRHSSHGVGLFNISSALLAYGGSLSIKNSKKGSVVEITLPL